MLPWRVSFLGDDPTKRRRCGARANDSVRPRALIGSALALSVRENVRVCARRGAAAAAASIAFGASYDEPSSSSELDRESSDASKNWPRTLGASGSALGSSVRLAMSRSVFAGAGIVTERPDARFDGCSTNESVLADAENGSAAALVMLDERAYSGLDGGEDDCSGGDDDTLPGDDVPPAGTRYAIASVSTDGRRQGGRRILADFAHSPHG